MASAERRQEELTMPTLAERLREEIVAWDAVLKSAFRIAPYNPDSLLGEKGFDTYERMMGDGMVRAAINTKRYALLAKPWQVFAATPATEAHSSAEAEAIRDFVEMALRTIRNRDGVTQDFRQALFQLMAAFYRGYSVAEMIWRLEETGAYAGKYLLAAIKTKPPKQTGFVVDDYLNVQAITSWTPLSGLKTIPRGKCVLYVHNPQDGLPYGESDLKAVYKHWWSKDTLTKFWNLALQKYGMPMVYAHATTSAGDGNQILTMLNNLQQDSSAVFPANVTPQLLQATMNGAEAFTEAVDWHNQQIAQGILLQTLTSGEGRRVGSLALGQVHFDVLLYVLENAKADLEEVVNTQIVRPLVDFNFADAAARNLYPRFSLGMLNEKNLLQLAQAYDVLLKHGVINGREQAVREAFDLPPLEG